MNFKFVYKAVFTILLAVLTACTDDSDESNLVDVHTLAAQDIIAITFEFDGSDIILSANSEFEFILQGLKSNGRDVVTITQDVQWSLTDGAASRVDQHGRFTAGPVTELITLTAKFGLLTTTIDIRVSAAKFDRVVQLSEQDIDLNQCQSQTFEPLARYIDEDNNEEIRPVDSNNINAIEWIILNQENRSVSQRAYIETIDNKSVLNALAAGDIIIQARAISLVSNSEVTSAEFTQSVSNMLNSIKLCRSNDTDLNSCGLTSASIEQGQVLSLTAVGNFQTPDGSNFNENITKNSKWGIDNTLNASGDFSNAISRQHYLVTGETEASVSTVSVACGEITQPIVSENITQGISLDGEVSCSNTNCFSTSISLDITNLSVESFEVIANDITLSDDVAITLDTRPDKITLKVTANFVNNTRREITTDSSLIYSIIDIDGSESVIEEESGSPGTFTVLAAGTARIQLNYRGERFIAELLVP